MKHSKIESKALECWRKMHGAHTKVDRFTNNLLQSKDPHYSRFGERKTAKTKSKLVELRTFVSFRFREPSTSCDLDAPVIKNLCPRYKFIFMALFSFDFIRIMCYIPFAMPLQTHDCIEPIKAMYFTKSNTSK